jgi:3-oxoacyl-[acyl-carrier protein] reductase
MRLEDRIALVTGGAHGIGAAYGEGLAREGAHVVVADLDGEGATRVAEQLSQDGPAALAVQTDVADEQQVQRLIATVTERFGRVDVLINNAAMFSRVPMSRVGIEDLTVDEWDRMMTINLRSVFLCCREVLPVMRRQGSGSIVNIASGTVFNGPPTRIHYVTTKAGVVGFTRVLAREVGGDGIRVNAIAPGSTLSEEDPSPDVVRMREGPVRERALARVERPADLVGTALFLASDDSAFMTGQTLIVDGGVAMH